ncbi:hypothetical protein MMM112_12020 [Helicobacter pylori]
MLFFMLPKSPLLRKKEKKGIKDGLIDESERESLKILNKEMEKILGGTLQGASNSQRPNGFLWPCIGFNPREWFLQKQTKISRSF